MAVSRYKPPPPPKDAAIDVQRHPPPVQRPPPVENLSPVNQQRSINQPRTDGAIDQLEPEQCNTIVKHRWIIFNKAIADDKKRTRNCTL